MCVQFKFWRNVYECIKFLNGHRKSSGQIYTSAKVKHVISGTDYDVVPEIFVS